MSAPATISGKEVFDLLRDDLIALEDEFGRDTVSNVGAITEIGEYLRNGGGKRIRPALLLLSAKLLNYQGQGAVRLGAVVEIIHTATLVHDDIIDEADTRRGRPSANRTWGSSKSVLVGDWLYMQAFKIALSERKFRILELLIGLTQQMVEGELMQMEKLGSAISESEYNDLIYRKTACLFEVSMRLGACLSGADRTLEDAMGNYGCNLGMAFQVIDDVLDLTATEQVLGKPVASDLREGKATLAVIHALENGLLPSERNKIGIVLSDRNFNYVSHEEILRILNRSESVTYAMNTAYAYAAAAQASLACLPESEYKRALQWMPEFVVARDK